MGWIYYIYIYWYLNDKSSIFGQSVNFIEHIFHAPKKGKEVCVPCRLFGACGGVSVIILIILSTRTLKTDARAHIYSHISLFPIKLGSGSLYDCIDRKLQIFDAIFFDHKIRILFYSLLAPPPPSHSLSNSVSMLRLYCVSDTSAGCPVNCMRVIVLLALHLCISSVYVLWYVSVFSVFMRESECGVQFFMFFSQARIYMKHNAQRKRKRMHGNNMNTYTASIGTTNEQRNRKKTTYTLHTCDNRRTSSTHTYILSITYYSIANKKVEMTACFNAHRT